jgi:hypothetical protein
MSVNIKDASGATVPIASATMGSDQVQQIGWAMQTRGDNFAATGNGTTINVATLGMSRFSLQVKKSATGTVSSSTVVLEVSNDGTSFTTVLTHNSAVDADGSTVFSGTLTFPARYFRSRCSAIANSGGGSVDVTIVGMP